MSSLWTPRWLLVANITFGVILLTVGLWPLNFWADNAVMLVPGGGLRFEAPAEHSTRHLGGMVFTRNPLICSPQRDCEKGSLTIELALSADTEASSCGVKTILDFRAPDGGRTFIVGQWKSSLIIRSFTLPPPAGRPYSEIGVAKILEAGRVRAVTIAAGPRGTGISVDGRNVTERPGFTLFNDNETLEGYRVYLGNSPELGCPWAGRMFRLAILGKSWTPIKAADPQGLGGSGWSACEHSPGLTAACYLLDALHGESILDVTGSKNDLWMPKYLVFNKSILGLPNGQSFSASDLIINLLGFVPLGFLICLWPMQVGRPRSWTCLVFATAVGCMVSLTIEVTQVWLPGRDSSLLDLIANTAGTAIGGAMGRLQYMRRRLANAAGMTKF